MAATNFPRGLNLFCRILLVLVVAAGLWLSPAPHVAHAVTYWYVKWDATGTGTGTNWTNAFTSLQYALENESLASGDSILVARGTYKPVLQFVPGEARTETFALVPGVLLQCGYSGSESNPFQRDWNGAYQTFLDGDIGTAGNASDNAYHVLTASLLSGTAQVDGCIIQNGNASYSTSDQFRSVGGGMYVDNSVVEVSFSKFINNAAAGYGGEFSAMAAHSHFRQHKSPVTPHNGALDWQPQAARQPSSVD